LVPIELWGTMIIIRAQKFQNSVYFSVYEIDRTYVPNLHKTQMFRTVDGCDVEATCCLNVINPYLGIPLYN
jgi:hypothetical protein